ncbi:MAG: acyl carrier protein [Planctomycetaceae bacterium]|nr:Acyl carrier protein [Planctomycetota bacterium]MCQ3949535.1 acyl carrier protein [Planctomycetota bacterium]NUO15608.1 acyl carrier protein [Planctomycetaceae bacterium]
MNDAEIKQAIIDIISDIAPDEDTSNLKPDVRLREQMDLDSMDFLDIVMELRKRYGVNVPDTDYMQLATLDSCVNYLRGKLVSKTAKV